MQSHLRPVLNRGAITVLFFCIINVTASQAAPPKVPLDDLSRRVASAVDGHIMPRLQQLVLSTNTLSLDVANYCEAGSPNDWDKAGSSFKTGVLSWAAVSHLRFGPFELKARARRISFSPDPRGIVWRQLRPVLAKRDEALLQPGILAKQSIAIQGLTALEILLAKPIQVGAGATLDAEYKCALASAIAKNILATSQDALTAWTKNNGWRKQLLNPGGTNKVYETMKDSITELVESAMLGFQIIRDQQIDVLQKAVAGKAKLSRLPFHRSQLSAPYLLASIEGSCELFEKLDLVTFVPDAKAELRTWAQKACLDLERVSKSLNIPSSNADLPGQLKESDLQQLHADASGMR